MARNSTHPCKHCSKSFGSGQELGQHVFTVHRDVIAAASKAALQMRARQGKGGKVQQVVITGRDLRVVMK